MGGYWRHQRTSGNRSVDMSLVPIVSGLLLPEVLLRHQHSVMPYLGPRIAGSAVAGAQPGAEPPKMQPKIIPLRNTWCCA
jgi:hypothetical protein